MSALRKVSYVIIAALWAVVTLALVERYHHAAKDGSAAATRDSIPDSFFEDQWMGIYMSGEKIGYSFSKLTPDGEGYWLTERFELSLNVMGERRDVNTAINVRLDSGLSLRSFDAAMAADMDIKISGEVRGGVLEVSMRTPTGTRTFSVPMKSAASFEELAALRLVRDGFKAGESVRVPVVDPSTASVDELTIMVAGVDQIEHMGKTVSAHRLDSEVKGIRFTSWMDGSGRLLRQESSLGFTFVRESAEEALRATSPTVDLLNFVSVPFDKQLPRDIRYLKVRISGIDAGSFELDGGRQRYAGGVLEVFSTPREAGASEALDNPSDYKRATPYVQAAEPEIIRKARGIVSGAADDADRALRINQWVFESMTKTPYVSVPSALDVLRELRGDCNEHTVLYTALARAAGLPTRMAAGLVYLDGAFYYHAWPEVYLGSEGGWTAMDPTFGQYPADASHIRLVTGGLSEQAAIMSAVGHIRIEGIEFR